MYYSREDRIAELSNENERVQWQDQTEDIKRIEDTREVFDEYSEKLDAALITYMDTIFEDLEDPDFQEAALAHARNELIEAWAFAQATLSKVAYVLRFDGNDAFQRMMEALKKGETVDMRGL